MQSVIPIKQVNQSLVYFDKKNYHGKICFSPYTVLAIGIDGSVSLCDCSGWQPSTIGNIFQQSLKEILSGTAAQAIRNSIANGTYEFCNENTCGVILQNTLANRDSITEPAMVELFDDGSKFIMPRKIWVAGDLVCNLSCPSCRPGVIKNTDSEAEYFKQLGRTMNQNLFQEPSDEHITLHISTSGEVFASSLLLSFISSIDLAKFPNLKLAIQTNGLLAEKFWYKLVDMQHRVSTITVTTDAATKESYEQLRRGGKWEDIQQVLKWLSNKKIQNQMRLVLRMIVQKQNYPEMVEFYNQAMALGADEVQYAKIMHWDGTYDKQQFDKIDVFDPTHSEYTLAQKMLDSLHGKPKVFISGGLHFTNHLTTDV